MIFVLWIEAFPEFIQHAADEIETSQEAVEAILAKEGFGKPDGQLEVFAFIGDAITGELDDDRPIGGFAFALPFPLGSVVIFAARFLDLVVDGIVAEAFTGRVVPRDRLQ